MNLKQKYVLYKLLRATYNYNASNAKEVLDGFVIVVPAITEFVEKMCVAIDKVVKTISEIFRNILEEASKAWVTLSDLSIDILKYSEMTKYETKRRRMPLKIIGKEHRGFVKINLVRKLC